MQIHRQQIKTMRLGGGLFAAVLILAAASSLLHAENIVFPQDAGVINIRDCGALGDGVHDDTEAIQKAVTKYHAHPGGSGFHIIYFPNGTYLVSDQITWGTDKYSVGPWIQGQSRDGVVLRVKDHCATFQGTDKSSRKAVLYTGDGSADNFGNIIKNLTIHTGKGNPGACGIRYNANNWGTLASVRIISGDGTGYCGIDMEYTDMIGPCFVNRVEIEGFDYGVAVGYAINSSTFEDITVRNQRLCGFKVRDNVVSVRKLASLNNPLGVQNQGGWLTLLDSTISGGKGGVAITNSGRFYARNLRTDGYASSIENATGHRRGATGACVEEFCAHEPASLFGKPPRAIHLPVKEIPVQAYEWDSDLSHWVSPTEFGAIPEDNRDDTDAFQKAIDTPGKTTLYLPKTGFEQTFTINGTLRVRGDIRRVLACDILSIGGKGRIVVEDGSAPVVVLERLGTDWNAKVPFEHNTRRTVVFSTIVAPLVIGNGAGDCFLNDVCALLRFNNPRQHLWGRQLNPESAQESCIINNGATFWGLGAKIEYGATALETLNGGKSELFGLHYYDVHKIRPEQVMFVIENASATLVNIRETQFSGPENFKLAVRETRGGETRVLRNTECPVGGLNGFGLPLYIASPENDSPK